MSRSGVQKTAQMFSSSSLHKQWGSLYKIMTAVVSNAQNITVTVNGCYLYKMSGLEALWNVLYKYCLALKQKVLLHFKASVARVLLNAGSIKKDQVLPSLFEDQSRVQGPLEIGFGSGNHWKPLETPGSLRHKMPTPWRCIHTKNQVHQQCSDFVPWVRVGNII